MTGVTSPEYVPQSPFVPDPQRSRRRSVLTIAAVLAVFVLFPAAMLSTAMVMKSFNGRPVAAHPSPSVSPGGWCGPNGCFTPMPAAPAAKTPSNSNLTKSLGDSFTVSSSGVAGRAESTWTAAFNKVYTSSPNGYGQPERGVFYAIRVDVSVASGEEFVYSSDFAFIAADGTAFEASSATYGFPAALTGTRLGAGQKVGGLVVFDVPQAALAGAKIELRPNGSGLSDQQAFWSLP